MRVALIVLQIMASVIVLAEGLNKLERADPWAGLTAWRERLAALRWLLVPWHWRRAHVAAVCELAGWAGVTVAAFAEVAQQLLARVPDWYEQMQGLAALGGLALLLLRTRLREG